jgi:hypothetical protein
MPDNCKDHIQITAFIQDSNAEFIERERERERERPMVSVLSGGHMEMRISVRQETDL